MAATGKHGACPCYNSPTFTSDVAMPIYEYKCQQCGAVSNHLARNFTTELHPVCPRCKGAEMQRLISRPGLVRMQRGGDAGGLAGDAAGSVAGYARQLRDQGGALTPEMRDALDHLATEAGGGGDGGELWGTSGD